MALHTTSQQGALTEPTEMPPHLLPPSHEAEHNLTFLFARDPKGWVLERLNTQKLGQTTAPGGKQWLMEGTEISVSVI